MKNTLDHCLLGLVVCIGLGLVGFNATWSLAAICPNEKEARGICTSCTEMYIECLAQNYQPALPETESTFDCEGGGLKVNSDGNFGVTPSSGMRSLSAGSVWCTKTLSCYKTTPQPGILYLLCSTSESESKSSVYTSESCGE